MCKNITYNKIINLYHYYVLNFFHRIKYMNMEILRQCCLKKHFICNKLQTYWNTTNFYRIFFDTLF